MDDAAQSAPRDRSIAESARPRVVDRWLESPFSFYRRKREASPAGLGSRRSVNRATGGDWPELFDAARADADWTGAVELSTYQEGIKTFRVTDLPSDADRAALMGETSARVFG